MKKEIRNGIVAGLSLIFFYVLVMTVASRSWSATVSQFRDLWYWILLLSSGFGLQVGLYTRLKNLVGIAGMAGSRAMTATSTGTSAAGMVACCAHHLVDVLPLIGLTGFTVFLVKYQIPLIVAAVVINIFGIMYILKQIYKVKKHVDAK